jgi:hypothetical protein
MQGESQLAEEYRLDSKPEIDRLFGLIKKNDWKATEFLFFSCEKYCRIICLKRNWHFNIEDLNTIINFSIGKAIAKYKICGKYWGLLGRIFANEAYEILVPIIKENELGIKPFEEGFDYGQEDPQLLRSDSSLLIQKALAMMPEEHRICIQLELEGYTDEQIKEFMDTTKSIKDMKCHAKMNLKNVLIENFYWKPEKD